MKELECEYLSNFCLRTHNRLSPIASEDGHSDSGYGSELERTEYELYIPAPSTLSREQAFDYHLATRNLLAYAVGKPVVGERLSTALSGVWQRMQDWDPKACSLDTFKSYCKAQGYFDLAENPEHALAFLKFAEDARLRDVWIEAFVHCVGMQHQLDASPEWSGLSNTAVALITRASLEMDLHITRVVRALSGFLEEELGAENLGLSRHARDHLDRFRSFLHAFYVDKLGYFPPKQKKAWNKRAWSRVHHDFQCLHDYLVDRGSSFDLNGTRGVTGGVCVVQNLSAFDQRHGYDPLPHPLPLLPATPPKPRRGVSSQRGLRSFSLGISASAPDLRATTRQVLEKASNKKNQDVMACNLVQEYQRFERQRLEEKLDLGEARKIRWILIYAILQMLNSIMKGPTEVVDTTEVSYPLCSLITGCPPWKDDVPASQGSVDTAPALLDVPRRASPVPDAVNNVEGRSSRISIHPDCEAENAEQFFASTGGLSRSASQADLSATPAPLRINTQVNRRSSIVESMHSSVNMLHRSVFGSLNRTGSSRRSSIAPTSALEPKKMPSFREIVVEGYGNGLELGNGLTDEPEGMSADECGAAPSQQTSTNDFALFDFGLASSNDEPTLEFHELAEPEYEEELRVDHPDLVDVSPRDSHASEDFALYRISSNGSYGDPGTPVTEPESGEDEEHDSGSFTEHEDGLYMHPAGLKPMQLKLHSYMPSKINSNNNSNTSVNAGCYMPTGMLEPPTSRFSHTKQSASISSMLSTASSIYPEQPVQADDIEEEDVRGRRRSRALDGMTRFGSNATTGFGS